MRGGGINHRFWEDVSYESPFLESKGTLLFLPFFLAFQYYGGRARARTIGVPTPHSWCNASKEHDNRQKDPLFESLPSFFLFNSNIFRCYCPKMESKPYWSRIWMHIFFTVISLKHFLCLEILEGNIRK